jgi:DNA invertase Pin-like site-specific DNA recombinase
VRAAIYARVSDRKRQDPRNQLPQLKAYIKAQKWTLVKIFTDRDSGAKADRPEFLKMFESASRREFDVVIVWALDRFTRQGIAETFTCVGKLRRYGVDFESFTEPHFRTTGPAGELMLAVAAWVAEFERRRLIERINAGLENARKHGTRSGKRIGPPMKIFNREKVREARKQGLSFRKIGAQFGISEATVRRACSTR